MKMTLKALLISTALVATLAGSAGFAAQSLTQHNTSIFTMAHIKDIDEKLAYYRRSVDEAEHSAKTAIDADMQMAHLAIARTWIYLAEELERERALSQGAIIQADDILVPSAERIAQHPTR